MAIKNLIFDAGGVLCAHNWKKLKDYILKKHGFSVWLYTDYPKKIQNKYKGLHTGKTAYVKVLKGLSGQKDITKLLRDYERAFMNSQKNNLRLLKFIKKVKKKYQILGLTNTNDLHFQLNTRKGIFKDFRKVYASSDLGLKKPDRRAFLFVLRDSHLNPKETLFIDDRSENLAAARKLGMKALIFKNNKQFFREIKKFGIKYYK